MRIGTLLTISIVVATVPARGDEPAKSEGEKHWSYTSGITPGKWGEVSPTCKTGTHQSPIAISTEQVKRHLPLQPLEFSWSRSSGELVDTGHSYQVNLPPGNSMKYGGVVYELQQFHFHTPSEHTVDGKTAPMEAHFVHKSADGKLAVVALLLKSGASGAPFATVLTTLPTAGDKRSVEVDLPAILPADHWHFAYSGSLTTPPCSEDVQWIVMRGRDVVSKEELDAFRAKYSKNARPVQPAKGRTVEISP
jgi:carbonic anhydrase